MERLRHSVAIASGKGGVGKSTTALNLAVYYAKNGLRVALADLDPLSNLTTILDVPDTHFDYSVEEVKQKGLDVSRFSYRVFDRLDLLFPRPSERSEESIAMRTLLFRHLKDKIEQRYDIVLLDMPAGIDHDENLAFLPLVETVLVVVQPEPTSHVSAGGYIRTALNVAPQASILLWHNKYSSLQEGAFDPRAVVSNYNRYSGVEHRITRNEADRVIDIAFVPHDLSLDLLQTRFSFEATLYHRMLGMLDMMVEELTPALRTADGVSTPTRKLLRTQVLRDGANLDTTATLQRLEKYLADLQAAGLAGELTGGRADGSGNRAGGAAGAGGAGSGLRGGSRAASASGAGSGAEVRRGTGGGSDSGEKTGLLTEAERSGLVDYVEGLTADTTRSAVVRARDLLNEMLSSWEERRNTRRGAQARALDKRVLTALSTLAVDERRSRPALRNAAGCLLLYVAVHKLLAFDKIRKLLSAFVPVRRDEQGKLVRDRYRQIRSLIEHDEQYHRRFFQLVKRFFPLVLQQASRISEAYSLQPVVLRTKNGEVHRTAYLKLLTSWMHDTANSGLGISVGLAHTTAARSIQDGAKALAESFETPL